MRAKGRQCRSFKKLTPVLASQIRERSDENQTVLAAEFGVSIGTIQRVVSGKTWKGVAA